MKVYTITGFDGPWPVGTAAVVVARNRKHALELLNERLRKDGMEPVQDFKEFEPLDMTKAGIRVLCDGTY